MPPLPMAWGTGGAPRFLPSTLGSALTSPSSPPWAWALAPRPALTYPAAPLHHGRQAPWLCPPWRRPSPPWLPLPERGGQPHGGFARISVLHEPQCVQAAGARQLPGEVTAAAVEADTKAKGGLAGAASPHARLAPVRPPKCWARCIAPPPSCHN